MSGRLIKAEYIPRNARIPGSKLGYIHTTVCYCTDIAISPRGMAQLGNLRIRRSPGSRYQLPAFCRYIVLWRCYWHICICRHETTVFQFQVMSSRLCWHDRAENYQIGIQLPSYNSPGMLVLLSLEDPHSTTEYTTILSPLGRGGTPGYCSHKRSPFLGRLPADIPDSGDLYVNTSFRHWRRLPRNPRSAERIADLDRHDRYLQVNPDVAGSSVTPSGEVYHMQHCRIFR